jgi:hypothetical protein
MLSQRVEIGIMFSPVSEKLGPSRYGCFEALERLLAAAGHT